MYDYKTERPALFTERGQVALLKMRDEVQRILKIAGAIRMGEAMNAGGGGCRDTWQMLACVDRLVEIGDLREITGDVSGQDRVFVSARR